jgi:hypothetical protein
MQQNIRVRVTEQPFFIRELDSAQDELPSLDQTMHVIS